MIGEINALSTWLYATGKDSPAKLWWDAQPTHPAVARALKIDPAEKPAIYALAPFRLARIDGQAVILCALPCPHVLAPADEDFLRIETVLAWDPVKDEARVFDDDAPQLVGTLPNDAEEAAIYGSPFAFFRAIAEERARFATARSSIVGEWMRKPVERDETPGLLLIGDIGKVRWPIHTLPQSLTCIGIDAQAVNRAMLRQAHIPRARSAPQALRAA